METPRHLIHVGFPKAGATFFKAWCRSRDDIQYVDGGFAGYRAVHEVSQLPVARLAVTSNEGFVAGTSREEFWTHYRLGVRGDVASALEQEVEAMCAMQRGKCHLLHDLFPNAHILLLVRGYRSAVGSLLSQTIKSGGAWWYSLSEHRDRVVNSYCFLYDYDRIVEMYEEAFGRSQVTVLPYELLRDDREQFVRALCAVGGLPYRPFNPGRVNASPSPHSLGLILRCTPAISWTMARLPAPWDARGLEKVGRVLARVRLTPWFDRLARALGVAPLPRQVLSEEDLRATFAGLADTVARRPEVAPYAADYLVGQ